MHKSTPSTLGPIQLHLHYKTTLFELIRFRSQQKFMIFAVFFHAEPKRVPGRTNLGMIALVKRQWDHPAICSNARGLKPLGAQCYHWCFYDHKTRLDLTFVAAF